MDSWKIKFINHVRELIPFDASPDVLDFIACQFALESAFGRSSLAVNRENYCGMKKVSSRITSQVSYAVTAQEFHDSANKFGMYNSLYECIIDYSLWLAYNKAGKRVLFDLVLFKAFLIKHHYCPEPDYIIRITNLLNLYKNGK